MGPGTRVIVFLTFVARRTFKGECAAEQSRAAMPKIQLRSGYSASRFPRLLLVMFGQPDPKKPYTETGNFGVIDT